MPMGTVKWFNESKGYGFITSGGKDYFVYFKDINSAGFKTLMTDQKVSFVIHSTDKGMSAKDVVVV